MENLHTVAEFHWGQKGQQTEAHYKENTQLHEDNQLEEKCPDVCDKEPKERSHFSFPPLANDDAEKKIIIKHKESEHT